ncbi:MAG: UTRA domain-containing protein [Acidimicrobiales bacterium]
MERPAFEQRLGALYSLFSSMEAAGVEQRSEVLDVGLVVDAAIADRLGLDDATELFRLRRLRLADDEPLALDTAWLPADLGRPLLGVDFSHTALYDELERSCGCRPDRGGNGSPLSYRPPPSGDGSARRPARRRSRSNGSGSTATAGSKWRVTVIAVIATVSSPTGRRRGPAASPGFGGTAVSAAELPSVDPTVERLARMLHDAFDDYHERFLEITHRAPPGSSVATGRSTRATPPSASACTSSSCTAWSTPPGSFCPTTSPRRVM